jgi:hypothetical protein
MHGNCFVLHALGDKSYWDRLRDKAQDAAVHAGCTPGSCNGFCDKFLMAICVEGHVGRLSAAQYGHKVSNTGLSIHTDAVVVHASRRLQVNSGAFVDDFSKAVGVRSHARCEGVVGGCMECQSALPAAQQAFDALDQMMRDCALVLSTKGVITVAQRHVLLGVIIDTIVGRLFVTEEKFAKLMELLQEVMGLRTCSARNMARLRGKAKHQLRCIEGVGLFLSALTGSLEDQTRYTHGTSSMRYQWSCCIL